MKRPGSRPFRAVVYLPGHDEHGRGVAVAKVSAACQEGLDKALKRWRAEGYAVAAYEEVALPLEGGYDGPLDHDHTAYLDARRGNERTTEDA